MCVLFWSFCVRTRIVVCQLLFPVICTPHPKLNAFIAKDFLQKLHLQTVSFFEAAVLFFKTSTLNVTEKNSTTQMLKASVFSLENRIFNYRAMELLVKISVVVPWMRDTAATWLLSCKSRRKAPLTARPLGPLVLRQVWVSSGHPDTLVLHSLAKNILSLKTPYWREGKLQKEEYPLLFKKAILANKELWQETTFNSFF